MTSLESRLQADMTAAMKSGDKVRLGTIRQLRSQFQYEKLSVGDAWSDETAEAVLVKAAKMRRESITQYERGNRPDLVEREQAELKIIEEYLPEQLGEAELDQIIDEAISATGASGSKDMGRVMGLVMPKVKGRTDGAAVGKRVREKLGAT